MRNWCLLWLVFLLLNQHGKIVQVSAGIEFIESMGVHFMLNGSFYYANGFNAYWLMVVASDPSQRCKISSVFQEAVSNDLTLSRTWAFSDGGPQALQFSPGVYNEQMFQVTIVFHISCFFKNQNLTFLMHASMFLKISFRFSKDFYYPYFTSKIIAF